jgi:tetratricopeptide (TPR) repeat protein
MELYQHVSIGGAGYGFLSKRLGVRATFALLFASCLQPAKAFTQSASSQRAQDGWQYYLLAGETALKSDHPEEAIKEFSSAIQSAPTQKGLHEDLGDAIWASGRMEDAAGSYQSEIALNADATTALFKLGSLEVIRSNAQLGVPMLQHCLKLDPTLLVARYYLGRGEVTLGSRDAAISDFRQVTETRTDDATASMAWYQLAILYRRFGNSAESQHAFEEFRRLHEKEKTDMPAMGPRQMDRKRQLPHPPTSPMQSPY